MRILVTGGAGFIGSQIADAYIDAGHEVEIVDDLSTGVESNINRSARFHRADIRDREAIDRILADGKFDLINHHAAQLDIRISVRDPQYDASVNVIGSLNLLQGAHEHGVGKVIFASSGGAVYGEQEYFPADERHPTNPIAPYGVTKLTVEKYLHYYEHVHGLRYVAFRYTNVYGPRQNPHGEAGVVAIFCESLLGGRQPVINGSGRQTRDYVYVGDVVRANVKAVDWMDQSAASVYNICTGIETSVVEIFDILNTHTGGKFQREHAPAKAGEQMRSVCTAERAAMALDWRPEVELDEGLRRTVEYFRRTEDGGRRTEE